MSRIQNLKAAVARLEQGEVGQGELAAYAELTYQSVLAGELDGCSEDSSQRLMWPLLRGAAVSEELAKLDPPDASAIAELLSVAGGMPRLYAALVWLLVREKALVPVVEKMLALSAAADSEREGPVGFLWAIELESQLWKLVGAETWDSPAQVLDPDGERGVDLEGLLGLARWYAKRSGDERWATVRDRLTRAKALRPAMSVQTTPELDRSESLSSGSGLP